MVVSGVLLLKSLNNFYAKQQKMKFHLFCMHISGIKHL